MLREWGKGYPQGRCQSEKKNHADVWRNVIFLFMRKLTPPYTNNPKNCDRYSFHFKISTIANRQVNCEKYEHKKAIRNKADSRR